jgi:2-deoxy-D-gluconate 3-dehydrogenase
MLPRQRGKIIFVASALSFTGGITVAPYAAAKSGVAGLTRALSNEWAPKGLQVNALAPGYIHTAMTEALVQDPERSREILARVPAGRWGEPEDLAGAAVFLASAASDFVSGAILPVDGGFLAR